MLIEKMITLLYKTNHTFDDTLRLIISTEFVMDDMRRKRVGTNFPKISNFFLVPDFDHEIIAVRSLKYNDKTFYIIITYITYCFFFSYIITDI